MPFIQAAWYDRLPVVTTIHFIGLAVVNCAVGFNFLNEYQLYYDPTLVFSRGQVWRLVTALLYHGTRKDFNPLVKLSLIVFSYNLEEGWYIDQHQNQRTADFLWFYILSSVTLLTAATIFAIPFLAMELHLAIVVVWAYRALGQLLGYKGVTIVSGAVVLMAYRAIVLSMWGPFAALGIGFMYYFLEDVFPAWPISRGVKLLKTPAVLTWLESWIRA